MVRRLGLLLHVGDVDKSATFEGTVRGLQEMLDNRWETSVVHRPRLPRLWKKEHLE
jgi:hypothetical protein